MMDDAMKFFMTNIDSWGVEEHFDRLVSAVEEHDKCVVEGKEESERELYQNIFTSQALTIARDYSDVIKAAIADTERVKVLEDALREIKGLDIDILNPSSFGANDIARQVLTPKTEED